MSEDHAGHHVDGLAERLGIKKWRLECAVRSDGGGFVTEGLPVCVPCVSLSFTLKTETYFKPPGETS